MGSCQLVVAADVQVDHPVQLLVVESEWRGLGREIVALVLPTCHVDLLMQDQHRQDSTGPKDKAGDPVGAAGKAVYWHLPRSHDKLDQHLLAK